MIRQRLTEARLAVIMLSRLPISRLPDPTPTLSQATWAYPLVGLPLGVIAWATFAAAIAIGLPNAVAALLSLTALALVTGALHHDGLADFADGIGGGRDKNHCLEIMRDSRIGSYGVVALILTISLSASSLSELGSDATLLHFLLIAVASRLIMTGASLFLPAARPDGLGHSSATASSTSLLPGCAAALVLIVLSSAIHLWVIAAMIGVGLVVSKLAKRRIGGQTGDVLGATQLLSECLGWISLAALLNS